MKLLLALFVVLGFSGCATNQAEAPQAWQAVHVGMSRQQVYSLIGRPDDTSPDPGGLRATVLWDWDHWQKHIASNQSCGLDVLYDTNWLVKSINIWTNR